MPNASIDTLGNAGKLAADRLIESFHPQGGKNGKGWEAHRQTRLKTFLGVMQPAFSNIAPALASGKWDLPLEGYNQKERKAATHFLAGVQHLGQLNNAQSDLFEELAPKPVAQVKISPRI
ncbi:hypothetical protein D3C73_1404550 [compost metagenome]